jgi:hypothetical protein
MREIKSILLGLALGLSLEGCASANMTEAAQTTPTPQVIINYKNQGNCSFPHSPVNFCDPYHTGAVSKAIKDLAPNFNSQYILLAITERPKYHQKSIVAINPSTGHFYPVPIDFFSGTPSKSDPEGADGRLEFGLESNRMCVSGDIVVYRSIKTGNFCFFLEGERFTGYHTTYMD